MKQRCLFFSLCLLFCMQVSNLKAQPSEVILLNAINPENPNNTVWINTSKSVYPIAIASPVAILATGILQKNTTLQHKGFKALGSLLINTALTQGLKYTIRRDRPYITYAPFVSPYQVENDPSFPSGHTSTAFATATSLTINFKKWYVVVPAYTWATAVGYARMYMGEHYPSDVLAGAVVGSGSALLSHWLTQKYFNHQKKKKQLGLSAQ